MSKSRSLGGATSSRASSSTARLKVAPPKAASPSPGAVCIPPAATFDDLPPLDPGLLRGAINALRQAKRNIIHSVCAHADRIPGLLPHLTCTVGGIDEILSLLAWSLPPEARP